MTKTDIAWAAGIFDGEGCVHINRQLAGRRKDIVTDAYRLYLKVTMGHLPTIQRLHEILGVGNVHGHAAKSRRLNASFSWVVGARKAERVVRLLLPFLVTKKEEAQIALQFFKLPVHQVGGSRGNSAKPAELVQAAARFYWQMRMAKSRWRIHKNRLTKRDKAEIKRLGLSL